MLGEVLKKFQSEHMFKSDRILFGERKDGSKEGVFFIDDGFKLIGVVTYEKNEKVEESDIIFR